MRRRRQSEKYATDLSQLNLRFQRPLHSRARPSSEYLSRCYPRGVPSHLLGESGKQTEESSDNDSDSGHGPSRFKANDDATPPPPPPCSLPPNTAENNARYCLFLLFFYIIPNLRQLTSQFENQKLRQLAPKFHEVCRKFFGRQYLYVCVRRYYTFIFSPYQHFPFR